MISRSPSFHFATKAFHSWLEPILRSVGHLSSFVDVSRAERSLDCQPFGEERRTSLSNIGNRPNIILTEQLRKSWLNLGTALLIPRIT